MDISLKHFRHECPLTLLLSHDDQQHLEKICTWCQDKIVDVPAYYGCSICPNFFVHKTCAELPRKINHPFHPQHPLSLSAGQPNHFFACDACNARLDGSHYRCSKCDFDLDHNCASLIPINANHHDDDDQLAISSSSTNATTTLTHPVYGRFLAHQSCAKLPQKILQHPFHLVHPRYDFPVFGGHGILVLGEQPDSFKERRCKACRNHFTGGGYYCAGSKIGKENDCKFLLHIECALPMLSIKFKIHQHPLAFFSKPIGDSVQCVSGCTCSNEECRSRVFRCVPCGTFDCHLHCVPTLPLTFKRDDCHRHALTLTKSPVNYSGYDDEEDYVTELYCDACEKPRNRECPTYYCAKCHYVAHVLCIISEEDILALREELRMVELDEGVLETSEGNNNLMSSLRELDEEIDKMTGELEILTKKLETLKHKRDRFISSHPQLRST